MNVENNDWLDDRLAVKDYLPDDGFTAQVLERLPKKRRAAASPRWLILGPSIAIAVALFVAQAVPLFHGLRPIISHSLSPEAMAHFAAFCRQPMVSVAIPGGIALLALSVVPFLRRWV